MTGGNASDVVRIAKQEHFECHEKTATYLITNEKTTWASAAVVEALMRAGLDLFTFNASAYDEIRANGKSHVLSRLNEIFAEFTGTASVLVEDDLPDTLPMDHLEHFIENIDDVSPAANYLGSLSFDEWQEAYVDTITHADDGDFLAVHICIVHNPSNNHASVVAWQMSKDRNKRLLKEETEARQKMQNMQKREWLKTRRT